MQMMLTKHSHLHQLWASIMHSQHWRDCMLYGRKPLANIDICPLFQLSTWVWQSSISTTNAPGNQMPISWQWVLFLPSLSVMTMLKDVSTFIYLLPFLFLLYQWPEPSETFYDSPHFPHMTHILGWCRWHSGFHGLLVSSIWLHLLWYYLL